MKIQKTFTIDENVWNKFNEVAKAKSYNKSLLIENYMKQITMLYDDPVNVDKKLLQYFKKDEDSLSITYTTKEKDMLKDDIR